MGLQKTKNLPDGTSGTYWMIDDIRINRKTLNCHVKMGLYIDRTHAMTPGSTALNYIKELSFQFTIPEFVTGITPTYVYTKILAYANSTITPFGAPVDSPTVTADVDLAGATVVT